MNFGSKLILSKCNLKMCQVWLKYTYLQNTSLQVRSYACVQGLPDVMELLLHAVKATHGQS